MRSRDELETFIASLRIPESRRALVAVELRDHLESRIEAELVCGADAAEAELRALEAIGSAEDLRKSLERIEPAFELSQAGATSRGIASAGIAAALFAAAGLVIPGGAVLEYDDPVTLALSTLPGFVALWMFAPRGIGAAIAAEISATLEPRPKKRSPRRRAVLSYIWSMIGVAYWSAATLTFIEPIAHLSEHVLMRFGIMWLPISIYGLHLFSRARRERKLLASEHHAA